MTSNEYKRGGRREEGREGRGGREGGLQRRFSIPPDVQIPLLYILLSSRIT